MSDFEIRVLQKLDHHTDHLISIEKRIMNQVQDLIAAEGTLHAAVLANTQAVQAAVTKLNDTIAQLATAQFNGTDTAALAELTAQAQADAAALQSSTAAMTAAVTPAAIATEAAASAPTASSEAPAA